ncbi:uncharacterized protein SPPG_08720 [Spizellomyces punctatus DAOM BR117]|uniref:Chitinase domain-containing protein 1 n=1 Tax=Spizellomyces punctatus (strain DAOM BR117) TaxID=645134 RepID=A0A0L0H317_SPIPD|nr:uncharacterized protein SPPG_08720 [Spizellomyces punctatus DAOM BR117]KNC95855.1 hypothetical protein SPPG_08720 [Spizellomyces punctatus DAOM BR117]|eukprot:XP_016603895.1 hypothetical protein SPPG_08720 [Spizellomyces punctatus DAOM BR117]
MRSKPHNVPGPGDNRIDDVLWIFVNFFNAQHKSDPGMGLRLCLKKFATFAKLAFVLLPTLGATQVPLNMQLHAWIYPGSPALNAPDTYRSVRIHVLRPQYFTLQPNGILKLDKEDPDDLFDTKNGFSLTNVADIKAHSDEQLVTVSCQLDAFRAVYTDIEKRNAFILTLVDFCNEYGLTGIDLDLEAFSKWSDADYANYKSLVSDLGMLLQSHNRKLSVCGPTDYDPSNQNYRWRYEDFINLPVDYITPMCYDYQWLDEVGAPIAPLKWIHVWTQYLLSLGISTGRLVIGLPSYSYRVNKHNGTVTLTTLEVAKALGVYDPNRREATSAEIMVDDAQGDKWVISDNVSLREKVQAAHMAGASKISVWHLGGNEWF